MRLGIVGTGMISCQAIPVFEKLGIIPAALCSTKRSIEKAGMICAKCGIRALYTDMEQMIWNSRIDTVYLGIPNHLHYQFAKTALENGANVILEKPFTVRNEEAKELAALARKKDLYLFEAISTIDLPAYKKVQEWLPEIGTVKIVFCNYSQYSSRYDKFLQGIVEPVFDPKKAGGALMDLGIYNLHFLVGLFGAPDSVNYQANMDRGVDTSGILTLTYPDFQAVSIAAKDCKAPCSYTIQGTKGYILVTEPANSMSKASLVLNDGTSLTFDANEELDAPAHRMEAEFKAFLSIIESENMPECERRLAHTLKVMEILSKARASAAPSDTVSGIVENPAKAQEENLF